MYTQEDICSGEKFQQLCNVYCGSYYDLHRNPKIAKEPQKHIYIENLDKPWDNPKLIFCYSCALKTFMTKLHYFKNEFILVSHNEDDNITTVYTPIVENPLVKHWYAQNVMMDHPKLTSIPIGVANEMWPHGNLSKIVAACNKERNEIKKIDFLFNFSLTTNPHARNECKNALEKKGLHFLHQLPFDYYLQFLASSKFSICPEGNGIDCHRVWESLYMGVIPIMIRSIFTEKVASQFPCILLNNWDEFDAIYCISLYDTLVLQLETVKEKLKFSYFKNMINNI